MVGIPKGAHLRMAAALGDVHPAQRLRSKTAAAQPLNGLPLGSRGGPDLAIHARCSLAVVFRHSLRGQCLGRKRVDQKPLQGFHPAPVPFTSCLGDTSLQSPRAAMNDRPADLVPVVRHAGGRRIRSRGSHTCWPPVEGIRHTLSPFHTTRKSAPLSGGARCLLSGPLQPGVRLLRDPMPAARSHALQRAYPTGPSGREDNGFTEFHGDDAVGWVLPIYRRCRVSVSRRCSGISDRVPFWLRRLQLFRLFALTIVTAVHFSSPDHRAWPLIRL
jgi:hypothetical protein